MDATTTEFANHGKHAIAQTAGMFKKVAYLETTASALQKNVIAPQCLMEFVHFAILRAQRWIRTASRI